MEYMNIHLNLKSCIPSAALSLPALQSNFSLLLAYRLILQGFKRPLVNDDLWALGKNNKSLTIVPKFMEKWAKEEERCAM